MSSETISGESEAVQRAIETYDHLLWEAIILVCGDALSKSFQRQGNRVRVVYQTAGPDCLSWSGGYPDPRGHLPQIKEEIARLINLSLPIKKIGKKPRLMNEAKQLCSRLSYQDFLRNVAPLSKEGYINSWSQYREGWMYDCDFVEIGNRGKKGYICCPCVGQHLSNTKDLAGCGVNLQEPKRVGNGTYEFRFEVVVTT